MKSDDVESYLEDFQKLQKKVDKLDGMSAKKQRSELVKIGKKFDNLTQNLKSELGDLDSLVLNEGDGATFQQLTDLANSLSSDVSNRLQDAGKDDLANSSTV
jgi:hypothetical protein